MAEDQQRGPNQILPAENLTATTSDARVRLRIPKHGTSIETADAISVPGLLQRTAGAYPDKKALGFKKDGVWQTITYKEYLENVRTTAKGFLHLGLERHRTVGILGFNSPEWFYSDLGAIFAGGIAVGIYTTNSNEACFYCLDHSQANICVVQDDIQLRKILAIKSRLPNLKAIIQYEGKPTEPGILSWEEFMEIGRNQSDDLLEKTLKSIAINECCTIVYTSGTVGQPKGVMISHDNITWDALSIGQRVDLLMGEEVIISYLPLSHVAAQIIDIYIVTLNAACVYFADKNALKGSLVNTLQEVQPTKFLAVPRVWEKIYEKMAEVAAQNGPIKRAIGSWAKNQALQHHLDRIKGNNTTSWGYHFAKMLIFKRIREALGFSRCTIFASAAAPLSTDLKRYFLSIDLPIMEAFGMSEASGAHTLCTENSFGIDTIGTALPGTKSKIHNPTDGEGELCIAGRHIFMGYLNDEEKTREAIDDEGWLHTGDVGKIDDKNFLYITGRIKELIITAGGENVAPVPIEHLIKFELPHVSNAFVVGDQRKFLSVLLTLKTEVNSETNAPLDTLTRPVQEWLKSLGCPAKTVAEVLAAGPDPKLLEALKAGIDRVNQQAVSNAQRIQKLSILPVDFSMASGELGPTMKVKRNVVTKKYKDLIDEMYK